MSEVSLVLNDPRLYAEHAKNVKNKVVTTNNLLSNQAKSSWGVNK